MDVIWADVFTSGFYQYWQEILTICGVCLFLDTLIMSQLKGPHRAERSHYLLSIFSVICYIMLFPLDSEVFRHFWIQILLGLYLYDLCIIARDWPHLKPSYRVFYSVHHGASLGLFILWYYTFVPFTDAMALGALLWVSSDVWRWAEQVWRLSGGDSSNALRDAVYYLERAHRLIAYGLYLWVLGFQFNHTSEMVLLASGLFMDAIDTYFQRQARRIYKIKQQGFRYQSEPPNHGERIDKKSKKKAA